MPKLRNETTPTIKRDGSLIYEHVLPNLPPKKLSVRRMGDNTTAVILEFDDEELTMIEFEIEMQPTVGVNILRYDQTIKGWDAVAEGPFVVVPGKQKVI